MKANSPTLPPIPAKAGPGRKRSGPVPAWALKLGGFITTLAVFAGSFGYTTTHLYVANAPLQPATVAAAVATSAAATAAPSTTTTSTTTLTPTVRTTTRAAVTKTASS
jgi:hypothetical protein